MYHNVAFFQSLYSTIHCNVITVFYHFVTVFYNFVTVFVTVFHTPELGVAGVNLEIILALIRVSISTACMTTKISTKSNRNLQALN